MIQNKCSSGIFFVDISDHLPNFSFLDIQTKSIKDRPFTRLFTDNKIKLFKEGLITENVLIEDSDLIQHITFFQITILIYSINIFLILNNPGNLLKINHSSQKV